MQFTLKISLDLELKKHSDYLTGPGLILYFVVLGLEKFSEYLNWILFYIELGLEKHQGCITSYQHVKIKFGHKLTLYGRRNNSQKVKVY